MFSEEDLRTTLVDIERDAPSAAEVRGRLRVRDGGRSASRLRRGRPAIAGLAAAAAVIAVAVGGPVVLHQPERPAPRHSVPAGGHRAASLAYDFALAVSAGTITDRRILPDRQVANVTVGSKSTGFDAQITVYAAGVFDPSTLRHGDPVRVQGHPGYVTSHPLPHSDQPRREVTVGWRFERDRWATVAGSPRSASDGVGPVVLLAKKVHVGATPPVRVPFKLSYLPPGTVVESLLAEQGGARLGFGDGHRATGIDADHAGSGSALTVSVSPRGPTPTAIRRRNCSPWPAASPPPPTSTTPPPGTTPRPRCRDPCPRCPVASSPRPAGPRGHVRHDAARGGPGQAPPGPVRPSAVPWRRRWPPGPPPRFRCRPATNRPGTAGRPTSAG